MSLVRFIKKQYHRFIPSRQTRRTRPWFAADGDYQYRLIYEELNKDSLVVDLGGYKGQWAGDIYAMYQCRVLVVEPVQSFAAFISNRFKKNNQIEVFALALGNADKTETIHLDADGTSTIRKSGPAETIQFRPFDTFMKEKGVNYIDLLKINIEGGEYDLLDHILETGWHKRIGNFQVQFHEFVPGARERMQKIQQALSQTHQLTFQYEFVWENWKLLKPAHEAVEQG